MLFACAGYRVSLYDADPSQISGALSEIESQLRRLRSQGYTRGTLSLQEQLDRISPAASLKECLDGAFFVQVEFKETQTRLTEADY